MIRYRKALIPQGFPEDLEGLTKAANLKNDRDGHFRLGNGNYSAKSCAIQLLFLRAIFPELLGNDVTIMNNHQSIRFMDAFTYKG